MFDSVSSYYKVHSKIYDLTRWSILFGRDRLLEVIPNDFQPERILDLGCGTGKHLVKLAERFPDAKIIGVDASKEMLNKASVKIKSFDGRFANYWTCIWANIYNTTPLSKHSKSTKNWIKF